MVRSGGETRVLAVDAPESSAAEIADGLAAVADDLDVTPASDTETALEALSGVDCVVVGDDLPGADGVAFVESVRGRHPDLPVVLVPAEGDESIAAAAVRAGVTDYLPRDPDAIPDSTDECDPYRHLAACIERAVDERRTRREDRTAAERFRSLAECIADPLVVVDTGGRICYVNPAVERVFGYSPASLRGEPISRLFPAYSGDRHPFDASDGGPPDAASVELRGRHRDGHELTVEVSVGEFEDETDRFYAAVVRAN